MTRKRVGDFIFVSYKGDHPPPHVHVHDSDDIYLGRFDIENQASMDSDLEITRKLKKALEEAGYIKEKKENGGEV